MDSGNYGRGDRQRSRTQGRGGMEDRWRDDADMDFGGRSYSGQRNRGDDWDRDEDRRDTFDDRSRGRMMDAQEYGGGRSFGDRNRDAGSGRGSYSGGRYGDDSQDMYRDDSQRSWGGDQNRGAMSGRQNRSQLQGGEYDRSQGDYRGQSTRDSYDEYYGGPSTRRGGERDYNGGVDGWSGQSSRRSGGSGGSYGSWNSQADGTPFEGADYRQWSRDQGLYGSSEYSGQRQQSSRGGAGRDSMGGRSQGMDSFQGQGSFGGRSQSSFSGIGPRGWQRSDDRIREDVNEALARHDELDASNIEVEVSGGEVTLSGTVTEKHAKRMAEEVAEGVFGVSDVQNSIRVQRNGRTQGEGQQADGKTEDGPYAAGSRRGDREVGRTTERDGKAGESRTTGDGTDKNKKTTAGSQTAGTSTTAS